MLSDMNTIIYGATHRGCCHPTVQVSLFPLIGDNSLLPVGIETSYGNLASLASHCQVAMCR